MMEFQLYARIKTARYEKRPNIPGPFNAQLSLTGDSDTGDTFEFHIVKSTKNITEILESIQLPPQRARTFHYRVSLEIQDADFNDMLPFVAQLSGTTRLEIFLAFEDERLTKEPGDYTHVPSTVRFVWNLAS